MPQLTAHNLLTVLRSLRDKSKFSRSESTETLRRKGLGFWLKVSAFGMAGMNGAFT